MTQETEREALPFTLSDDATNDPIQAIGEVLLHACASDKGYLRPWKPFDVGTVAKWCISAYEQARARVGKVDDMYTNSPVSIPIAETCIQSEQAKPIEVGELFDVMGGK